MESASLVVSRHPSREDSGYSLIEIMVTVLIMGTLFAIAINSFSKWAIAKDHEGTAVDLQTILRQTQTRAITEGVSFCVTFDTNNDTYTVSRYACDTSVVKVVGPFRVNDARIDFSDVRFRQPDGSVAPNITFRPTGTATPGQLTIVREGSDKTYVVAIEGFTGRVSTS